MQLLKEYGTTTGGWKIGEPVTMTTRAKNAWTIKRGGQHSLIELRNGDWHYMKSYDTSVLPPKLGRGGYLLSIRGKGVELSKTLQGALEALGLNHTDSQEAVRIIGTSK
jgi:hypothetical protein